jgi:muramidase (phage lysozyme)
MNAPSFITAASPAALGGVNIAAFCYMLSVSEGTDNGRQATKCHGYDVMVGGSNFTDFSKHPRVLITLNSKGLKSTAAGRYQFIASTWDDLSKRLKLTDFSAVSQDFACVELLKQCGAYNLLRACKFDDALKAARNLWASLPGAGYGQLEQKTETLRAAYIAAGGTAI